MKVIETQGLTKSYGKVAALKGIDLTVGQGEVHGFIGMNGAGKSTTIRILLGLLRRDAGQVSVLGGDPFADSVSLHRRLAYVPSDVNPWPSLSGGEVIDLMTRLRGKPDPDRRDQLIERFQLDPSKPCRSYSRGNRQKVGLIAALASDVELYILDEPSTGLDPLMESVFQDCLRELAAAGRTVFLSSHILSEVQKACDHVTVIRDGIIVESGSLHELRQLSRLTVQAQCAKPLAGLTLPEAHNLTVTANQVSFTIDPSDLNAALAVLTSYELLTLSCNPLELEDLFMHHYKPDADKTKPPAHVASSAAGTDEGKEL